MSLGQDRAAFAHWEEAGRLFDGLLALAPADPDRMRNVALVDKYFGAQLLDADRVDEGVARYRRALELDEQRLVANPSERQVQFDVAIDLANVASALARTGRRGDALALYDRSIAMRETLLTADPKNRTARLVLIRVLAHAARLADLHGQQARTRAYMVRAPRSARTIRRWRRTGTISVTS